MLIFQGGQTVGAMENYSRFLAGEGQSNLALIPLASQETREEHTLRAMGRGKGTGMSEL